MPSMDVSGATLVESAQEFEDWLATNGATQREAVLAIYKQSTGKQSVTFDDLLEVAFCHGWVDVQTKRIDDETYAIRFVPRRPGSNWSARNRGIVRRLLAAGRLTPRGIAVLPNDLDTGQANPPR